MKTTPFLQTMKTTLEKGLPYPDRTGKGRHRMFGAFERYDLSNWELPADTTTQLFLKTLTKEVLAFKAGSNKIQDLGEAFWRKWSPSKDDIENKLKGILDRMSKSNRPEVVDYFSKEESKESLRKHLNEFIDTIGPMYGVLWRNFPKAFKAPSKIFDFEDIPSDKIAKYKEQFALALIGSPNPKEDNTEEKFKAFAMMQFDQSFDQLALVVKGLKEKPYSSRHRVSAYHPDLIGSESISPIDNVLEGKAALSPCHSFFQFMVTDDPEDRSIKRLNCKIDMSSSDICVGRAYNICQYALLTFMLCHCLGFEPGELILTSCDTHIYLNHLDQVQEHLSREPLPYPKVKFNPNQKDFFALGFEDIEIIDYQHHPKIHYEVAV